VSAGEDGLFGLAPRAARYHAAGQASTIRIVPGQRDDNDVSNTNTEIFTCVRKGK
jgi:hypothetical protein